MAVSERCRARARWRKIALPFASLLICGCHKQAPTIAIDNWWTVDYARNSCQIANTCGLDKDNPGGVQDYINSVKAQFAAASSCQGVTVLDYRGPAYKNNPVEPDEKETLIIDYVPNQSVQHFAIMGQPSSNIFASGTVPQIVDRSCIAARGLGANVR